MKIGSNAPLGAMVKLGSDAKLGAKAWGANGGSGGTVIYDGTVTLDLIEAGMLGGEVDIYDSDLLVGAGVTLTINGKTFTGEVIQEGGFNVFYAGDSETEWVTLSDGAFSCAESLGTIGDNSLKVIVDNSTAFSFELASESISVGKMEIKTLDGLVYPTDAVITVGECDLATVTAENNNGTVTVTFNAGETTGAESVAITASGNGKTETITIAVTVTGGK